MRTKRPGILKDSKSLHHIWNLYEEKSNIKILMNHLVLKMFLLTTSIMAFISQLLKASTLSSTAPPRYSTLRQQAILAVHTG